MVPQSTYPALALVLVALVVQIRQTAAYSCDDWRWSRGRFPTSRFVKRWGIQLKRSPRPCYQVLTPSVPSILVRQAAGGKDHESEGEPRPGMEEAFRQLEALQSLNDDSNDVQMPPSGQATKKIQLDTAADLPPLTNTDVSLEQEIAIYKDMVGELEQNEDVAAYSEILSELGGAPKQVDDTYAQVLLDLGGTPPQLTTQKNSVEQEVFLPTTLKVTDGDDDGVDISTEQFMDRALQEALKEVTVKNPKILGTDAKSVLDNKEIMREIEGIFDQGNEKLMASLEDIRLEQQALAKAQAIAKANKAETSVQDDAQRIVRAERSMQTQLDKVARETVEVEKAVADLRAAQKELDQDFVWKLRNGGLPKQAALVGFALFSVRSILDTLTAVAADDSAMLTSALAQGAIAIICAVIFFIV